MEKEEPKQETIEEVAENYSEKTASIKILVNDVQDRRVLCESSFEAGAKWQAERMYSEEEVVSILIKAYEDIQKRKINNQVVLANWFEQFKKK